VSRSRANINHGCVQLSLQLRNHIHGRINPPGAPMVFSAPSKRMIEISEAPDHGSECTIHRPRARSERIATRYRRNKWLVRASRLCQIYLLSSKTDIVTSDSLSIIIRRCGPQASLPQSHREGYPYHVPSGLPQPFIPCLSPHRPGAEPARALNNDEMGRPGG